MDVIVGTAGHIDHGKTALVKALTGTDADRLPEEKQRGITIDLGFAEMETGDVRIGFVDVPGHERFVKNMLAGASGIDVVLLVVAADEGVMPQTREHFDICRLLHIEKGVIALTKTDLTDSETLELAKLDVADLVHGSFLENAPVFCVSSRTGEGIDELRAGLGRVAGNDTPASETHETRLAIDRSFSIKGFGAVVTGTLAFGTVAEGMELELLPDRRSVRVRGIQTHGRSVTAAHAGQRTAINLAGIGHDEITRGMVLATPGSMTVTQSLDAEVEMLSDAPRPLRSRQRVRLHIGTAEVLARVSVMNELQELAAGGRGFVQFRVESPVAAAHSDRFIIRSYSPQRTIGGGMVLDPAAPRHRRVDRQRVTAGLHGLWEAANGEGNLGAIFPATVGGHGMSVNDIRSRTGLRTDILSRLVDDAVGSGDVVNAAGILIDPAEFEKLRSAMLLEVEKHHRDDKLSRGIPRETLRDRVVKHSDAELFQAVSNSLVREGKIVLDHDVVKLAAHETKLSPPETKARDVLRKTYADAQLEVPKLDDALRIASAESGLDPKSTRNVFQLLVTAGELIAVNHEFYFVSEVLDRLRERLRESARASNDATIDVSRFKDIAGVSRKYAIPLLEYFDRTRVTVRVGDKRKVL